MKKNKPQIKVIRLDNFRTGQIVSIGNILKPEISIIEAENGERFVGLRIPRTLNEFIRIPADLVPGFALVGGGVVAEQFLRANLLADAIQNYEKTFEMPCRMEKRQSVADEKEKPVKRENLRLVDGRVVPFIISKFDYDANTKFCVRRAEFSNDIIFEVSKRIGAFDYFEAVERDEFIKQIEALPKRRAKYWLNELLEEKL